MLTQKLKKTDDFLFNLTKELNLLALTFPVNLHTEKENFFANSNYNPQFEYKIDLDKITKIEQELANLKIAEENWQGLLLNEVRQKFQNDCLLIKEIGRDPTQFLNLNYEKYASAEDLSDQDILLETGQEISKINPSQQEKKYDARQIQVFFEDFLKKKKIEWKVKVNRDLIPLLSVNSTQKVISINPLIQLSQKELKKMLAHEIETHIYRFLNGQNLFPMASVGLLGYEKTEEGLAVLNESWIYPEDKNFLQRFYLRYKAVLFGENNSFQKLYQYLREELDFNQEESWRTAVRVKRGLRDTSFAGSFLKDKIYLQGYFAVRNLEISEIKALYKGKFSLEHLNSTQFDLKNNKLVLAPFYLPDYLLSK